MSFAQRLTNIAPLPRMGEIRGLLDTSLRGNWFLRVEHAETTSSHHGEWTSWNNARYGMNDPEPLINDILNCHAQHPGHAIRLHAERGQPQTRMVYWVYLPERDKPHALKKTTAMDMSLVDSQMRDQTNMGQKALGLMTLIGVIMVSLFLFQGNVIAN